MNILIKDEDYNWVNSIAIDKYGKPVTGIGTVKNTILIIVMIENGKPHNLNGPAYIYKDGSLGYYINGKYIGESLSNKEFKNKIKELVFA